MSRCTFIMHNTRNLAFQGWGNRNYQTAVSHGRSSILVNNTLHLGSTKNIVQSARNTSLHSCQLTSDVVKGRGCCVTNMTEFIQNLIYLLHKVRERGNTIGKLLQGRTIRNNAIFVHILFRLKISHNMIYCVEWTSEIEKLVFLKMSVCNTNTL